MADEIYHPHDTMVRAVLSDVAEATSFLQRHLPQAVSQALNWSTLTLREGSFVDEDLRTSEADFLYQIEHVSGEDSLWLYVLLEHQSTPDRWMRFRLLKYCCRIWDVSFREHPEQRELRVIVPLVFYQGERIWSYSRDLPICLPSRCGSGRGCLAFPMSWSINPACNQRRCRASSRRNSCSCC
jgi:predicted transposase/invertase (TIGR01784 family)